MTDYTNITENFGDTICREFINKKEMVELVERPGTCDFYLHGSTGRPTNLIAALIQKVNNYLSNTTNDNEFIIGFTIHINSLFYHITHKHQILFIS